MKSQVKTLIILFFLISILLPLTHAETTPGEAVKQQIGFNPEDTPTNPQDIRDKYLPQEWSEILSKNKFIGPVHNTFVANPLIFRIVFGDPYSLSLVFLIIIILWVFIGVKSGQLFEASGILKGAPSIIAGFVFSILLAQTTIIRNISKITLDLVFKAENWALQLIIALLFFVVLFIISYIMSISEKALKERRKAKKEQKLDEKTEEIEALEKGLKN
ncbi:hypothetical protein FJZ18_02130 [Candidatus Pacearchaeota archaeon]|nr:hypothetical protein [Candidatus Pacearchaeota archaeon]